MTWKQSWWAPSFAIKTVRCFLSTVEILLNYYSLCKERGNLNKWSLFKCITHWGTACICRLMLPAMGVSSYVPVLLSILMCVGCHEYSTYSNMMENSTKNVRRNELAGTPGIGPQQQCPNEEQNPSVACMDPTIPWNLKLNLDDRNVSCPAWSVKHNGSSKCECGSDLHGKVTCCHNLEKLLIFQRFHLLLSSFWWLLSGLMLALQQWIPLFSCVS